MRDISDSGQRSYRPKSLPPCGLRRRSQRACSYFCHGLLALSEPAPEVPRVIPADLNVRSETAARRELSNDVKFDLRNTLSDNSQGFGR